MTHLKASLIALFSLALFGTTAQAATLFTAPMSFQIWFGTDVQCKLTNVADSPAKVRIRSITQNGNVDEDSGRLLLQPRESVEIRTNGAGRSYCRFDVDGAADRVRGSACTVSGNRCDGVLPAY